MACVQRLFILESEDDSILDPVKTLFEAGIVANCTVKLLQVWQLSVHDIVRGVSCELPVVERHWGIKSIKLMIEDHPELSEPYPIMAAEQTLKAPDGTILQTTSALPDYEQITNGCTITLEYEADEFEEVQQAKPASTVTKTPAPRAAVRTSVCPQSDLWIASAYPEPPLRCYDRTLK